MSVEIDARGLSCPIPVVRAKNALKEMVGEGNVVITVDNKTSSENLVKLAMALRCTIDIEEKSPSEYVVSITKTANFKDGGVLSQGETIVVLSSDKMGEGDETLGRNLLKAFVYALTESEVVPFKIVCYNGGVKTTTEGSPVIDDLNKLQERGTVIMSCGACLNYYELTDKLQVGEITNMYAILEEMNRAAKIIKP